ncbi:MAG: hypothetical protein EZS28_041756 [Streblomastix strix]|uniref:Uncharacterized protein n=1 Tax=Streblomastix strix TaxID=222440 RepID=A0A5J4TXX0_9EUKA|nr:MAG: hypothetical protein EZS28_041756 [Streblomastix strix]
MDIDPNRCVELRIGGNIDQRESEEGLCALKVERQQFQELQQTGSYSSSESVSRIPLRIDLIKEYWNTNTHRHLSYNVLSQQEQRIKHDRASSRQSHQVSRTVQLDNRSQPYSWPFEHYTRQLVKVIQMRRLCNQERSPLEDYQEAQDLDLQRHICNTRELTMHEVLQYLQISVLSSEMDLIQNQPRKFRYFTHQSLNYRRLQGRSNKSESHEQS